MSDEEQNSEAKSDKATVITRTWRQGGPFTPDQRKEAMALFLEQLKVDPTVMLACEYAGIHRSTVYRWKEKYAAFAHDWEDAVERTKDVARSSIYTRGILGWLEKAHSGGQVVMEYEPVVSPEGYQQYDDRGRPLIYGGKPLWIRRYSDTLAMGYARANLPEYKDKPQQVEHTGKDGGPIGVVGLYNAVQLPKKIDVTEGGDADVSSSQS